MQSKSVDRVTTLDFFGDDPAEGIAVVLAIESDQEREYVLTFTAEAVLAAFEVRPRQDLAPEAVAERITTDARSGEFGSPRRPVCPAGSPRVTRVLVRDVPLGALEAHGRHVATAIVRDMLGRWERPTRSAWQEAPLEEPRRRGHDDAFYAALAIEYEAVLTEGVRTTSKELARRRHVARNTITNQIREARRRGLLTGGGPGKPGGMATARARELGRSSAPTT